MNNNKFPRGVEVVVSAIIRNKEGKILLTRSPKWNNKYLFPGGHIESGETIEEATKREAKEEAGVDIDVLEVVASGELIDSKDFDRPAHLIYFNVLCEIQNDSVKLDGVELDDYVWLTPEEALKMDMEESSKDSLKKYINFKNKN